MVVEHRASALWPARGGLGPALFCPGCRWEDHAVVPVKWWLDWRDGRRSACPDRIVVRLIGWFDGAQIFRLSRV